MFRYISFLFLLSCAAPAPFEEYALAKAALKGAQAVQAKKFSPRYYRAAWSYFRQGEVHFKNKSFDKAGSYFRKSKQMFEKAEQKSFVSLSQTEGELY